MHVPNTKGQDIKSRKNRYNIIDTRYKRIEWYIYPTTETRTITNNKKKTKFSLL